MGVGYGEMRAGDEARAEGKEEKSAGEEKRFCGGTRERCEVWRRRDVAAPVGRRGVQGKWMVGDRVAHGYFFSVRTGSGRRASRRKRAASSGGVGLM